VFPAGAIIRRDMDFLRVAVELTVPVPAASLDAETLEGKGARLPDKDKGGLPLARTDEFGRLFNTYIDTIDTVCRHESPLEERLQDFLRPLDAAPMSRLLAAARALSPAVRMDLACKPPKRATASNQPFLSAPFPLGTRLRLGFPIFQCEHSSKKEGERLSLLSSRPGHTRDALLD